MTARDIIAAKRDGGSLTREEIRFFIRGYMKGAVTDYQASALLMAIRLRGMTVEETVTLTAEMRDSGQSLDLRSIRGPKIDKHSTGGVGDKTSLLVAPIAAACGITVPMITGRALGHTGGTLDKLQTIPGFDPYPAPRRIVSLLRRNGAVLMGQTDELAPADRRLYALRDATATVDSIPLITASILSKKLAEGIDGLVLDVKTGSGAFMHTPALAEKLAQSIAQTCKRLKTKVAVVITDMEQPLGRAVGNALEVQECLDFLDGHLSSSDLESVTLVLAARMLLLARRAKTEPEALQMAYGAVTSGEARRRFFEIVTAQGGDIRALKNPDRLPRARHVTLINAPETGVVVRADARLIGEACNLLGAGRARMEDAIDPAVGVRILRKLGEPATQGEGICEVYWNNERRLRAAMPLLQRAFQVGDRPARRRPLIHSILER